LFTFADHGQTTNLLFAGLPVKWSGFAVVERPTEVNPFSAVAKLLMAVIFLEYWQRACNCRPTLSAQRKRSRVKQLGFGDDAICISTYLS
jgi:hypothetical protein